MEEDNMVMQPQTTQTSGQLGDVLHQAKPYCHKRFPDGGISKADIITFGATKRLFHSHHPPLGRKGQEKEHQTRKIFDIETGYLFNLP